MYSVIYRMNKLANFISKERDECKLKASICAGITHKSNPSVHESSDPCLDHPSKLSFNEYKKFLSLIVDDLKFSGVNSYSGFTEKYSGVIYFLVHMNTHNFQTNSECMERREMNFICDQVLAEIHRLLLQVQQYSGNLDSFRKFRSQIFDLLFARNEEKLVSNCLLDTEDFLKRYIFLDNTNVTLYEIHSQWKNYTNAFICLLDDFYSSSVSDFVNSMVIFFRKWSDIIHSKVLLSQLSIQKLLSADNVGRLSLSELQTMNEILKIWSNISNQLKKIQPNLITQLDSTETDILCETLFSDNSSELFDKKLTSSKIDASRFFDLSFFDSFLFYNQSHEYTLDTRRHSCNSLQSHKPKSALKKSNDTSVIPEKVNMPQETETILWEPVYTMNKSLMKYLIHSLLQTLQDYASQLQFGCNPTAIDILNSSRTYLNQCENNLNIEYYNCLNMLLQRSVFATSVHGQLFNPSDLCFSDFWCHKNQNILDEQFNPGFTTQNMLCSWNGATGTGAGLPIPKIYISKSLQTFIAFNLEVLLPMILNLLQVDINDQQPKTQLSNQENSNNNFQLSDDNLDEDSLKLLISEVVNVLLTILNGYGLNKSSNIDVIDDNSTAEINKNENDTMEFVGLTAQLSTITLSVDWNLNGIEKLALCISDCLSLRAFCSLLASIFEKEDVFSVKSVKFNRQDNVKEHPQQTELEIEMELFSVSGHFNPVRIISLLTSSNYKLSLLILESLYANQSTDSLTDKKKLVANQLFISILRILDAIPEYADFLGKVVDLVIIPGLENCQLFNRTLLNHEEWPLWFDTFIQLMRESLENIWIRFKELKNQRLEEDESFQDYNLIDKLNENPTNILNNYTPKRRVYWDHLFPSGHMPCGCLLPEPFNFANIKQFQKCTSPTTDINCDNNNNNDMLTNRSSIKHSLKITSKFNLEEEFGNYANYYQKFGCSQEAWLELAYDIIRLPVIHCSAGLQLALTKINDIFNATIENQSVDDSKQINTENNNNSLYGQHFATHLVILFLNFRIHEEIKTKLLNNEYENQQQSAIEKLQYLILLEYLKSLLNVNDENEEIYACKKRVKSFLTERNNDGNDTESFIPGNSGRIFKNIQNLRFVQHKALSDLLFMHEFLHTNTTWISELIRNTRRQCDKTLIMNTHQPSFQLNESFHSNVYMMKLIDSIEELNWEKIYCINVGLQEL
ncbi:unnamed protein product [Schistosoma turkestanicum]|nr:unnamed protein product [Schistosoma turkestanicum]